MHYNRQIIYSIYLFLMYFSLLFSETVTLTSGQEKSAKINIIEQHSDYLIIEYIINHFDITEIDIDAFKNHKIILDGEPKLIKKYELKTRRNKIIN